MTRPAEFCYFHSDRQCMGPEVIYTIRTTLKISD